MQSMLFAVKMKYEGFMKVSDQLLNRITAGLVAVIIGFSSSIALIYQVVITLGGTPELVASWILMLV